MSRSGALFLRLVLVSTGLLGLACYDQTRRQPNRYLIPQGYVGWVRIDFGVNDALPLPIEDGFYLIKFPASGRIQTSTDMEYGSAKDEYYFYSGEVRQPLESTGWGEGGMIWGFFTGKRNGTEGAYLSGFVGTEVELKETGWKEKNLDSTPKVGPIRSFPDPAQSIERSPP